MAFPPSRLWRPFMADLIALHWPQDGARVLDLCDRARDYVELETGKGPDMAYAREVIIDAPPDVPPDQVWCWGHTGQDGTLDGVASCLKGVYAQDEWYLSLLLLDPAVRGRGLGADMAQRVIAQARNGSAQCLRIAVLDTNPRARAFWMRLGFEHEKSTDAGDGQVRHVHCLRFDRASQDRTATQQNLKEGTPCN